MSIQEMTSTTRDDAYKLLKDDAIQIYHLINPLLEKLSTSQTRLYQDVLDTHLFGLSKKIDFAVRLNLLDEDDGKKILGYLEMKLNN